MISGQELLVGVVVLFASPVVLQVVLFATEPEGVVQVVVIIVGVDSDIFSKVGKVRFEVFVLVVSAVVSVNRVN